MMLSNPANIGIKGNQRNIFALDYENEELIEQASGYIKQSFFGRLIIVGLLVDFVTGNIYGLGIQAFILIFALHWSRKKALLTLSNNRILINSQSDRLSFGKAILTMVFVMLLLADIFQPYLFISSEDWTQFLVVSFAPFNTGGFLETIISFYFFIVLTLRPKIFVLGSVIGPIIHFVILYQLLTDTNDVQEISRSKVVECTITQQAQVNRGLFGIVMLIYLGLTSVILSLSRGYGLGILFLLIVVPTMLIIRTKLLEIAIYGRSNKIGDSTYIFERSELQRVQKIIQSLFNEDFQDDTTKSFPQNFIPLNANRFETGLKPNNLVAYRHAKFLGAGAYLITFLQVTMNFITSEGSLEANEIVGLIFYSVGFIVTWQAIDWITPIIMENIKDENYFITENFEGYQTGNFVWLMKKEVIAGVGLKNQFGRRFIQAGKIQGVNIAWGLSLTLALLTIVLIYISVWFRFGAVNLEGLLLLIEYYARRFLITLTNFTRIQIFLSFAFSIFLWLVILLVYPRFYLLTRPRYELDILGGSRINLSMINENEMFESYKFGWSTSMLNKFANLEESRVIPGFFVFQITLIQAYSPSAINYLLRIGETQREFKGRSSEQKDQAEQVLLPYFMTSAKYGYPIIPLEIITDDHHQRVDNILEDVRTSEVKIKVNDLTIVLGFQLIKTES